MALEGDAKRRYQRRLMAERREGEKIGTSSPTDLQAAVLRLGVEGRSPAEIRAALSLSPTLLSDILEELAELIVPDQRSRHDALNIAEPLGKFG